MKAIAGMTFVAALAAVSGGAFGAAYTAPIDVLRHYDNSGNLITDVLKQLIQGSATTISAQQEQGPPNPSFVLDGGQWSFQYVDNPNQTADAGVNVRLTLDRAYTIQEFHTFVDGVHRPSSYEILGSTTGFGSLSTLVSSVGMVGNDNLGTPISGPTSVQFIEYRFRGNIGSFGAIDELHALVAPGDVDSDQGFNLLRLPGVTISDISTGTADWLGNTDGDTFVRLINGDVSGNDQVNGNGPLAAGNDARLLVDLGTQRFMNHITLGMTNGAQWSHGYRVEVSPDNVNFTTVAFQGSGNIGDDPNITFRGRMVQFIRITDFQSSSENGLLELQAFGLVPEPASLGLLGVGSLLLAARRRR